MREHENAAPDHNVVPRTLETTAEKLIERGERVLEVVALRRTAGPAVQAGRMVNRLAMTVAGFQRGACLEITISMGRAGMKLTVCQHGTAQPDWEAEVKWGLCHFEMRRLPKRRAVEQVPAWDAVWEIVARRSVRACLTRLPGRSLTAEDDLIPSYSMGGAVSSAAQLDHPLRLATYWPEPAPDDMAAIIGLLAEEQDLQLRYRFSPADPFEVDVQGEDLARTFAGDPERMHNYFGTPVRVRALIGSVRGPVPARARAVVCRGATGLAVRQLTVAEALTAWEGGPDSLIGYAVPERLMHALVRLPAAGDGPYPGFSTIAKPVIHPLDPVPAKPADPLRLGHAKTTGGRKVDVNVGARDMLRHIEIVGQSGAGKSTLIAAMVRGLIRLGHGCALLDPHGTTVTAILGELPSENHENVWVVRVGDEAHPMPLNVYDGTSQLERVIAEIAETIQIMYDPNREGIVGPRWTRWFSLIAEAAAIALGEQWSLLAVYEIGRDTQRVRLLAQAIKPVRHQLAKSLLDEIVADRSSEAASFLAWASSKLQPLVATSHMRAILGTGADTIDIPSAADEGRVLLFDLASTKIGDPAARMYGGLVLLKAAMAMGTRSRPDRPFFVIVDEAHLFEFGGLPKLLAEGRKHGIGVVVATQHMGQLRDDLATGLETNAGSMITLRTGVRHAQRSSVRLGGWPVEEIVRLPNLTAAASISQDGTMSEPFTLHIDHHQRMARAGARRPHAQVRGERAHARSLQEMWAPFAAQTPINADEVDRLLHERIAADREGASGGPENLTRPDGGFDPGRFLDDLAAQRDRRRTAAPASTSETEVDR